MARSAGRFSQLYVAITSGGSASPLQHAGSWSINLTTDQIEVTALGDASKTFVAGLPDGTISYAGFATDTASTALITAAVDGVARKWYAYPFNSTGIYFFGTAYFDTQWETSTDGAVQMSGSARQATPLGTVGF